MKENKKNIFFKLHVMTLAILFSLSSIITIPADASDSPGDFSLDILKSDLSGLEINLHINDYDFETIKVEGTKYDRLRISNSGQTADYGKAEIPVISFYVAIPQGAEIILHYESSNVVVFNDMYLYPSQPPLPETSGYEDPSFAINSSFYEIDEYYPISEIEISPIMIIRGCRIAMISVFPFYFNPVLKKLKVIEDFNINIEFVGGSEEFIIEKYRSIYFQSLFDAFLLNNNCLERPIINNPQTVKGGSGRQNRADLLIVVYDDFYEEILPLAEWRHSTGIETKVVKWSEIGTSAEDLRNFVKDAYYDWDLPPSFLLIVGDADHIPVNYLYTHPYHNSPTGTDHWYVAFEGDDYLPEIHNGRISVEDEDELTIVVDKILEYSKTPYMNVNWFDNILLAAKEESGRYFVYTSERIYDFLNPLGYECNRQYEGTSPPGSTEGVIEAIDNGVIIANHRDHGSSENDPDMSVTGWSAPLFTTNHISDDIENGEMYPVMYALHCESGWFDGETDSYSGNWESIGEVGIRVENKGFVAVISSTRVSYSGYNDELCVGLYDAMWSNFDPNYPKEDSTNPYDTEVYRIGQIMNYGKFWMYDVYIVPGGCDPYPWTPSETVSRVEFEMFHVHGDPTMEVWTAFPKNMVVDHPDMVQYGSSSVEVYVEDSYGNPVERALVCINQENGFYIKNLTDENGYTILNIEVEEPNDVTLIVTSHNYLFYSADLMVGSSYPPEEPDIDGPKFGRINKEYEYTAVTTDPEEDQIFYMFDWGDGTQTDWIGPVKSGDSISASHSWSEIGDYDVKAKAKDVEDSRSRWSDVYTIHMDIPNLKFDTIKGGLFFIEAIIKNEGVAEADDINWNIYVEGGIILLGRSSNGTISNISAGEEGIIISNMIFGFGQVRVKITASGPGCSTDCNRGGKVFFIYIHVNPGGS